MFFEKKNLCIDLKKKKMYSKNTQDVICMFEGSGQ